MRRLIRSIAIPVIMTVRTIIPAEDRVGTSTATISGSPIAPTPSGSHVIPLAVTRMADTVALSTTGVDLSPIEEGQAITVVWRGTPWTDNPALG